MKIETPAPPKQLAFTENEEEGVTVDNRFLNWADGGVNCFLTGMAGTGKSTLLRRFIGRLPDTTNVAIVAPTGIAALNVGGTTLHRWAGIGLGPKDGETFEQARDRVAKGRSWANAARRIRKNHCLVIDEISMLPGSILTFIDHLFRWVREDDKPFGGMQIIAIGDFLQLPPVRIDAGKPYDWAFNSDSWQIAKFRNFQLTKVHRQDDVDFVSALSCFRRGDLRDSSIKHLHARVKNFPDPSIPRLFTHNTMVDKWNHVMLDELPEEQRDYPAVTEGSDYLLEFLRKSVLAPSLLQMKTGARVMLLVNQKDKDDPEKLAYVNGDTGQVEGMTNGILYVKLDRTGTVHEVERFEWKYDVGMGTEAVYAQFPVRLAYAATIHKCQGLTMDRAYIDIRAAREPGQAYVALSRVRKLAGLHLKEWPKGVFVSDQAIEFHKNI